MKLKKNFSYKSLSTFKEDINLDILSESNDIKTILSKFITSLNTKHSLKEKEKENNRSNGFKKVKFNSKNSIKLTKLFSFGDLSKNQKINLNQMSKMESFSNIKNVEGSEVIKTNLMNRNINDKKKDSLCVNKEMDFKNMIALNNESVNKTKENSPKYKNIDSNRFNLNYNNSDNGQIKKYSNLLKELQYFNKTNEISQLSNIEKVLLKSVKKNNDNIQYEKFKLEKKISYINKQYITLKNSLIAIKNKETKYNNLKSILETKLGELYVNYEYEDLIIEINNMKKMKCIIEKSNKSMMEKLNEMISIEPYVKKYEQLLKKIKEIKHQKSKYKSQILDTYDNKKHLIAYYDSLKNNEKELSFNVNY